MVTLDDQIVCFNGQFLPARDVGAKLSVFDHGLLYGDGVFDTCGATNGFAFKLDEHIDRFYRSAQAMALRIPCSKQELHQNIVETVRRNGLRNAYIKFICTLGPGSPYLDPSLCKEPTLIIFAVEPLKVISDKARSEGVTAIICATRRIPPGCGIEPRIKQLNYASNVFMALEAHRAGVDESIALDSQGYVTEATTANIFAVSERRLVTPPPQNILEGITRATVFEIANREKIELVERMLTPFDLYVADEVFMTATGGAGGGIIPVVEISGRTIGTGTPGETTLRIQKIYMQMLRDGVHGTAVT
jgi:branched-chain amino acid aminotransferase